MHRISYLFIILFMCAACFSSPDAQSRWFSNTGKVKVLCTTRMIQDIVEEIGGDFIDCLTLIPGQSDPHSYHLVKGDDEKIQRADIIFYNGLGLEHGPSVGYVLKNSSKAYALGEYIQKVRPQDIVYVGNTVDPHVWMDISLWKRSIPAILEVLTGAIPSKKEQLEQSAARLDKKLEEVHAEIVTRMSSIPSSQRYLVSTHDAFNYFARAYLCSKTELHSEVWKERVEAPEGLAPDSQLSTADIKRLVDHIIHYGISVIFSEANVNRDSINKIADAAHKKGHFVEIAPRPLYADSVGPVGSQAENYIAMMRSDSIEISENLRRWTLRQSEKK